jgi:hypothetical protein
MCARGSNRAPACGPSTYPLDNRMERPSWFLNDWYWRQVCGQIVKCVDDLLAGRVGVIAASRILFPLEHEVRGTDDPDFVTFTGIYSESDALPVGPERERWSAAALAREDPKIADFEARCRETAFSAARRLKEKYAVV